MALDRKLNFVVPVDTPVGPVLVRSVPFSAAFFRMNFLPISKTFARLHAEGLGITTAPRVAAMMLERVERDMAGVADGEPRPPSAVMNEVHRLTNVEVPGQGTIPWDQAVSGGILSEGDAEEVENAVVFFTVGSSMYHRRDAESMLSGAATLWSARLEFSPTTAAQTSSQTSRGSASSGGTETASPIPR